MPGTPPPGDGADNPTPGTSKIRLGPIACAGRRGYTKVGRRKERRPMLETHSPLYPGDYAESQRRLAALRAAELYEDARHVSWWERLAGWLTRRSRRLLELTAVEGSGKAHRQ